ncbi:aminoglycoside phosphotransferase family protein [Streptomyces profundus]|uniref:aminoglycoside phosphotransferase family protein n=1 Tax=Streptomyces profundus TaxID=2867410 RepID=UPI001D16045C|nr:aminoglycoside phosphotransferase family protein [Streptomyces sp. MA3_2.13]UED83845.1 aminoglycoside phosphotransferase family protein [Streptomyces sp. MA3_2.13]
MPPLPRGTPDIEIPPSLVAAHGTYFGAAGRPWLGALPALARSCLRRWELRLDGPAGSGAVALVLPVRRLDGSPAVLKLQPVDEETAGEPAALRAWDGDGAVRLLAHDPGSGSMLLERLDAGRSLGGVVDEEAALTTLCELLLRLNAPPAPAGTRRLADIAADLLDRASRAGAGAGLDAGVRAGSRARLGAGSGDVRALIGCCAGALAEVAGDGCGDRLLHWDLHYDNVLAPLPDGDRRAPWLAIDPKPLAGDPAFELLPALHNRWDGVLATGDVTRAVLRRFDLMTDVLGLDRPGAVAWTLARVLENLLWAAERDDGSAHLDPDRAIAEALLTHRAGVVRPLL